MPRTADGAPLRARVGKTQATSSERRGPTRHPTARGGARPLHKTGRETADRHGGRTPKRAGRSGDRPAAPAVVQLSHRREKSVTCKAERLDAKFRWAPDPLTLGARGGAGARKEGEVPKAWASSHWCVSRSTALPGAKEGRVRTGERSGGRRGEEEEAGKNYPFRLRWRLRLRGGAGGVDNRSRRCETCE